MSDDYQKGFLKVSHSVLEDQRFITLTPATRILYIYLCKLQNRFQTSEGTFYRSLRQLSQDTGLDESTIVQAKKELSNRCFIECFKTQSLENKSITSCWYKVIINDEELRIHENSNSDR